MLKWKVQNISASKVILRKINLQLQKQKISAENQINKMKKVYYLSTCTTCKRIMDDLGELIADFEQQDIKTTPMSLDQIDEMSKRSGSYESLFSRKAMKYRSMGLGEKNLTEEEYRSLIHEEYTFLKRPVFLLDQEIFVGNSKKVIEKLQEKLSKWVGKCIIIW